MLEKERGLFELYDEDPEKADREIFGREDGSNRRGFLKGVGLGVMTTMLGAAIPYHRNMPSGFIPVALADSGQKIDGKSGLTILNDRPFNAETPPHLLNDSVTPTKHHFVRNNGIPPEKVNADEWKLTVNGEVGRSMTFSIADLKKNFRVVKQKLVIECAGNGRGFFDPPAKGNQWTLGAVACSEWTGVRLADVLKKVGVKKSAIYTAHVGADAHLSGKPGKLPISRGVPIAKAMDSSNLIAFGMNGKDIHPHNGAPLRLVVPGWPGSCSQKWLKSITLRDQVHDGPKMTGKAYRTPTYPVEPGQKVPTGDFGIIHSLPVKSLITFPQTGTKISRRKAKRFRIKGHAWAGDRTVKTVHYSIDFGATWKKASLKKQPNRHAWRDWSASINFPMAGYYEIWVKATDNKGEAQPHAIAWNPKGYLNNSMHRVAVRVG